LISRGNPIRDSASGLFFLGLPDLLTRNFHVGIEVQSDLGPLTVRFEIENILYVLLTRAVCGVAHVMRVLVFFYV
jgi:hypothetical protein